MQPPDVFQNVKTVQQRKPNLNFFSIIKDSSFNQSFVQPYLVFTFADISCSMLWMSPRVISSDATLKCLSTQVFIHEVFQLCQNQYTCVRGHSQIEFGCSNCMFKISLKRKFQLKVTILIFWTKFAQKRCFRSKTEKMNRAIAFCIFELAELPNFSLN